MPPRDKADLPPEPDPVQVNSNPPAGTVRLAVQYPHDVLHVGDGDTALEITSTGTDVPTGREDEVRETAKKHNVSVRKVS